MTNLIGIVKDIRFTFGSSFGEQYWTVEIDGKDVTFAMWIDFKSDKWAKKGEKVEIKLLKDYECSLGRSTMFLRNCADIVRIIKD